MLLQTFVQLNILLLAAPALTNWAALPLSPPLLVQAARVTLLPAAPVVEDHQATLVLFCRAAAHPLVVAEAAPQSGLTTPPQLIVPLCQPFPHAARAP